MSCLKRFDLAHLEAPVVSAPLPERIVAGTPMFKTWEMAQTEDGEARAGVWEVSPGSYRAIKGATWELCVILSGVSEITEEGKLTITVRAGDAFVMQPGFKGIWRALETTRKVWVTKG
jgi:uncharacterized protein